MSDQPPDDASQPANLAEALARLTDPEAPVREDLVEAREHRAIFEVPARPEDAAASLLDDVQLVAISHPRKRAYLVALAVCGTVSAAARASQINRATVQNWRKADAIFVEVEKQAMEHATDLLEEEARRRAAVGELEPVFGGLGGGVTGVVGYRRKKSDVILLAMLNAYRPEKFKGRQSVEVSGPGGGPIQTQSLVATIAARLDQIRAKRSGDVGSTAVRPEPEAAEGEVVESTDADGTAGPKAE